MTADDAADTRTEKTHSRRRTFIVVARHGERLDYVMRDAGNNWIPTTDKPWDPPLTQEGTAQGRRLGRRVQQFLKEGGLAPISAVYSSPFCHCRQTALAALEGGLESDKLRKIRVEEGLTESLNESWYRSWCLPGSNGTWGYRPEPLEGATDNCTVDETVIHPRATAPVQSLLSEWNKSAGTQEDYSSIDAEYKSIHRLDRPYKWGTFESRRGQKERMYSVVQALAKQHPGESILLLSHGGPVTHLFERLTGNPWSMHGESSYGCFSIYAQVEGVEEWEPLVVNESGSSTSERHID